MYTEYFGFKEAPFSIAPDPHYLYMTAQHREALAHLVYGLNSEGGCILLTGEVGTGKTTICRCLLEQLPQQANVALVLNPKVSEIELLETICDELNIEYPESNNSVKTYTDRIYHYLIESNANNEKTVLIIDEAQNLDSKVLEQLRLLTNLETDQRKLLQIIILGQPELLDILAKPEMRQLAQRITARFHLKPLTREEVKAYVSHRIAVAGQNIQLFPDKSISLLYKLSNGVPRLVNIICDRALLGAYVENQYAVHPSILKKAAKEVFGELKNVTHKEKSRWWIYPIMISASIAIAGAALYLYQTTRGKSETIELPMTAIIEKNEPVSLLKAQQDNLQQLSADKEKNSEDIEQKQITSEIILTSNTIAEGEQPVIENTEIPPEVAPEYEDIEDILNDFANSQISAYQALLKTWNQQYDNKLGKTACQQAELHSLSCLFKQGNLNSLKIHNRPAVLIMLNRSGNTKYVTITSIDNDFATIYADNTTHIVKLNELEKHWHGRFVLLWQKPEHYKSVIKPGSRGQIINWLNSQFQNLKPVSGNDSYSAQLVERVKIFQAEHGLRADGIVGPLTIIQMNTLSDINIPTLTRQN